jgi:hypothetical protein
MNEGLSPQSSAERGQIDYRAPAIEGYETEVAHAFVIDGMMFVDDLVTEAAEGILGHLGQFDGRTG